uniref:Uncharacterized protein n=1 Tax=Acrobeloides nanus TaxID=290746 RepID=A0A914DNB9_9BILA
MMYYFLLLGIFFVTSNAVMDLGAPGYTCDPSLMAPSAVKPTNVHAVRPADINLVMAMGDSLTAGYCTDDTSGCHLEYRGLSFGGGGDRGLDNHITISRKTQAELSQIAIEYQQAEKAIEQSGDFDTTDDFTLVVQPWFANATLPYFANGTVNRAWWAVDCYHFSSYGHALLSSWYWKNLLQPVGDKISNANLTVPALPLACPDPSCPYIRTTKNSMNCQQFNGTCVSNGGSCTTGAQCCGGLCFNLQCM